MSLQYMIASYLCLQVILVFMHNTGIYAPYCYLRIILAFMCDTGIYM